MNTPKKTFYRVAGLSLATALLGAAASSGAYAANSAAVADQSQLTEVVKDADLNLHSQFGALDLYMRLQDASREVCGDNIGETRPLYLEVAIGKCEQRSLGSAVAHVNQPLVTAIFQSVFHDQKAHATGVRTTTG